MSRTKAVSMDASLVGLLSCAAPEMFPLAPMIHRGAQRGDHSTRAMARWIREGWPFLGGRVGRGLFRRSVCQCFAQLWCHGDGPLIE